LGAAVAALGAGVIREQSGSYPPAFVISGCLALVAAVVVITVGVRDLRGRCSHAEPVSR